jgi:hypothetical protein
VRLAVANTELPNRKRKNAIELIIANKELLFQNEEKRSVAELAVANKELAFQNEEKKTQVN